MANRLNGLSCVEKGEPGAGLEMLTIGSPTVACGQSRILMFCRIIIVSLAMAPISTAMGGEKSLKSAAAFKNPEPVKIEGLPHGFSSTPISTEEPFLSRDGRFLFFNSAQSENNKDLHYAERIDNRWLYRREMGPGVNSKKEVEGNPTMDRSNNFFYVDSGVEVMVRRARFSTADGALCDVRDFEAMPRREVKLFSQKVHGNMGVEVGADGHLIFFSRATWDMNGLKIGRILASDILQIRRTGNQYTFDEREARRVLRHINTDDLEYAASISSDGLELFFTRLALSDIKPGTVRSGIYRTSRKTLIDPFGESELIEAIGTNDFVEGPAISADEQELYYHKRVGDKFRLYKVSRQLRRPPSGR